MPFLIEYIAEKKVTKIGLGDNFTIALGLTHPVVALKKLKMEFVKNKKIDSYLQNGWNLI